jgi:ABC-type transport system involved in multi-copper enzyme maturation permease subunit
MQTWALLVDSYRLLLSRKLFWITLVISTVIVLIYASIGFDETGWFVLFGALHFDTEIFKSGTEWSTALYMGLFSYFIVGLWLTWAATILALVSTSPIFNDFMADGSIDLVLSRPISRVRVFIVKYIGSLLFVVLQVAVFSFGVFLCAGWRVGEWNWSVFWAVPLIAVFFSYLYCVSVLMTMLTRSSMAAFLMTILFWVVLFAADRAERFLNQLKIQSEVMAKFAEINANRQPPVFGMQDSRQSPVAPQPPGKAKNAELARKQEEERKRQEALRKQRVEARKARFLKDAEDYERWRFRAAIVLGILPKTKQTTDLLSTWVVDPKYSMDAILRGEPQRGARPNGSRANDPMNQFQEIQRRVEEDYAARSPAYIIGTSLAFEAVILALSCFLFCRRDF